MPVEPGRVILTFRCVHDVLKAEKALRRREIGAELIPVPREIASDCGFCLVVEASMPDLASSPNMRVGLHAELGHVAAWSVRLEDKADLGTARRIYERIQENR